MFTKNFTIKEKKLKLILLESFNKTNIIKTELDDLEKVCFTDKRRTLRPETIFGS